MPDASPALDFTTLTAVILATGAVGTAAFGIVDALKWTGLGLMGIWQLRLCLGDALMDAIAHSYGRDHARMLRGLYREDRRAGNLARSLRQGVRVGLRNENAAKLAQAVGGAVDAGALQQALSKLEQGTPLLDADRSVLGRFELAVDGRIDAALTLSQSSYVGWMRVFASLVAIGLAQLAAFTLDEVSPGQALLVGLAAVPLAPIAKDVVAGLTQARAALSPSARRGP